MLKDALARLSRHTVVYAAAGQLSKLVGFALLPFYTAYLTKADYGVNELLSQAISVLGYIAGINMTTAMARHYFDSAEPGHRRLVVSTTLWTALAASITLAGLLALGAGPLGALISDRDGMRELVYLTLGILVLQLLREVFWRYLQTEERSTAFALSAVSMTVVVLVLQIWFVRGLGRGLIGLFEAVLISEVLAVTALAIALLPQVGLGFSKTLFRQLAVYTLPLVPNGVLQFCLHNADRYVLNGLRGEGDVGLYGFAYKLGLIPNFLLLTPFLMVWYPFIFSVGDAERQKELIARIAAYFLAVVTGAVLLISIFAPELVRLMAGKPEYLVAWPAVPWVCAGYWLWAAFQLAQTGFFIRKRTSTLPWLTGTAAAFNIVANLVLIPRYGWMAAAWITVATFLLLLVLTLRAVRPVFPVNFLWGRTLACAGAAGVLLAVGLWVLPADLGLLPADLRVVGGLPLGTMAIKLGLLAVWAGWTWFSWMTGEEREGLKGLLAGLRGRPARG
ncbi:MAG TPA: oligosaccharide flippase family protein [Planctomycetota bacterium]|nr:oligosaccharide flippase family protein [Planctomycetota bacterium]